MIDRKEKQDSICPINGTVLLKFEGLAEKVTENGVVIPEDNLDGAANFKGESTYRMKILSKAGNVYEHIHPGDYAIVYQLAGFGIPTVEDGYVKIVRESEILMTSKKKEFTLESITPEYGRALVKITSDKQETDSGVVVPKDSVNSSNWEAATLGGEIVKIAPGFGSLNTGDKRDDENLYNLKVGDTVRFDAYMGTDILMSGERYRMVLLSEVLCTIKK